MLQIKTFFKMLELNIFTEEVQKKAIKQEKHVILKGKGKGKEKIYFEAEFFFSFFLEHNWETVSLEDIYKVMHIFFPSPRVSLQDVTMNLCISQLFPLKVLLVYKWNGRNCILCLLSTIIFFLLLKQQNQTVVMGLEMVFLLVFKVNFREFIELDIYNVVALSFSLFSLCNH